MEKIIKRASLFNIVTAITIIVAVSVQLHLSGEYIYFRRARAILGYFIIIPSLMITLIGTIIVIKYYLSNRFNKPYKYLFLTIPSILILLYIIYMLILIVFKILI